MWHFKNETITRHLKNETIMETYSWKSRGLKWTSRILEEQFIDQEIEKK